MRTVLELFHSGWRRPEVSDGVRAVRAGVEADGGRSGHRVILETLSDQPPNHAQTLFSDCCGCVVAGPIQQATGGEGYFAARQHYGDQAGFLYHTCGEPWGGVWFVQRLAFAMEDRPPGAVLGGCAGNCFGIVVAEQSCHDGYCGWVVADSWGRAGESVGPGAQRAGGRFSSGVYRVVSVAGV